jgi:hypothetical protein
MSPLTPLSGLVRRPQSSHGGPGGLPHIEPRLLGQVEDEGARACSICSEPLAPASLPRRAAATLA